MTRPSHFVLPLIVTAGVALWASGELGRLLDEDASRRQQVGESTSIEAGLPDAWQLRGRVIDGDGFPLAGAELRSATGSIVRSDAAGRFVLATKRVGIQDVRVRALNHKSAIVPMLPDRPRVLRLPRLLPWETDAVRALPKSGLLAGEGFLRGSGGEFVAHGIVTVAETGYRAISDRNGRFRVPMPIGIATLHAHDNGRRCGQLQIGPWPRAQGLCGLPDLVVHPGRSLVGAVYGADGEPLRGAAINVHGAGVERQTLAGDAGAFRFDGLPAGDYAIDVLPDQGAVAARRFVTLQSESVRIGRIDLMPAVAWTVRLVDTDQDYQSGLHVVAFESESDRRAHGVTDAEGLVSLGGFGPGGLSFEVRAPRTHQVRLVQHFSALTRVLIVASD